MQFAFGQLWLDLIPNQASNGLQSGLMIRRLSMYTSPRQLDWHQHHYHHLANSAFMVGQYSEQRYHICSTYGNALTEWASSNDLTLLYDLKESASFHSQRWNSDTLHFPILWTPAFLRGECWTSSLDHNIDRRWSLNHVSLLQSHVSQWSGGISAERTGNIQTDDWRGRLTTTTTRYCRHRRSL